tara:strand:- start:1346 stop:1537 length:192 start_codon:yes stop_codon:yes gene_type:complete
MEFDFFKSFVVARELVHKVPPHGVHVSLADLFGQLRMVSMQKSKEVFVPDEVLLLYNLGIDIW